MTQPRWTTRVDNLVATLEVLGATLQVTVSRERRVA